MLTPFTVSSFINNWRVIAVDNIIISLADIAVYSYYAQKYESTSSKTRRNKLEAEMLMAIAVLLLGINTTTTFHYCYEKWYRKLYFTERRLGQSKLKWKAVLNCLPVGILIVNNRSEIKQMNKEIRSYIPVVRNLSSSFLVESTQDNLEPNPCDSEGWKLTLEEMKSIKDRSNQEVSLRTVIERRDDGEEVMYNMICEKRHKVYEVKTRYLPSCWPKGYKIAVMKDQTVYEQLIKEKMMEKYQRMLLASISHEIRNPLNAIEGYATMVAAAVSEQSRNVLDLCSRIHNSVQQVDLLLSGACDLMMLSMVDSDRDKEPQQEKDAEGKTKILEPRSFDLRECVKRVVEIAQTGVGQKPLALHAELGGTFVPQFICTDCKRYKTILFTLVNNAVKYTEEGTVKITARFESADQMLWTTVEDTGVGIDADKMSQLFELYSTNFDTANVYNPQGMGLGLSLCKKLSRALGGDISARSSRGLGSVFTFSVRCLAQEEQEPEIPTEDPSDEPRDIRRFPTKCAIGPGTKLSISLGPATEVLIVDDEPTNRLVLRAYLRSIGLSADEAANGRAALDKVKTRNGEGRSGGYRLIIMDINMPEMDGTTATRLLMDAFEKGGWKKAPILAVTAANIQTETDMQNLLAVGFSQICTLSLRKIVG